MQTALLFVLFFLFYFIFFLNSISECDANKNHVNTAAQEEEEETKKI